MRNNQAITKEVRKQLLVMHERSRASHIGSAFSCVEVLVTLFFDVMKVFPGAPEHPERDRFILSKGHAVSALYVVQALRGLLDKDLLEGYHLDSGKLAGHPDRLAVACVEASTGSLGHGLPIGVGMAYALKQKENPARVFVLMSDGEIQEGSVWEAANQASRLQLDNLIGIVDANGLQCFERTDAIMPLSSFPNKWEAFGWAAQTVDGHDREALRASLQSSTLERGKPSIVIAHTIKGKGILEFEDRMEWHFCSPRAENMEAYVGELDA